MLPALNESLQWGSEALWEQLQPLLPGLSIEIVARSASTNSELLERARVRAEPPTDELVQLRSSVESAAFGRRAADMQPCLLVAEHQTAGRGRQGRVWQAAAGASLTFSLSLAMTPPDWSGLSLAVGVAVADALEPIPIPPSPRIGLKWPNDLWLMDAAPETSHLVTSGGRKLGGILIETVAAGAGRLAVIGVGLNIAPQPADGLSNGYACLQEINPAATAPSALAQVAAPLIQALRDFGQHGFAPFAERFAMRDLLRGHMVSTTQAGLPEGKAHGVSASGSLLLQTAAGFRDVNSGEVSVRRQASTDCTPPNSSETQGVTPC